jgi:hypothetical protein
MILSLDCLLLLLGLSLVADTLPATQTMPFYYYKYTYGDNFRSYFVRESRHRSHVAEAAFIAEAKVAAARKLEEWARHRRETFVAARLRDGASGWTDGPSVPGEGAPTGNWI